MPLSDADVVTEQLLAIAAMHGLDRIADEVEQNLLDLHLLDQHHVGVAREAEQGLDPLLLGADEGERARLLDQLADVLGTPLGLAAGNELA